MALSRLANRENRILCLHYYSNALGFAFGDENEEVYRVEQIKEWGDVDPMWLDNIREKLYVSPGKDSFR